MVLSMDEVTLQLERQSARRRLEKAKLKKGPQDGSILLGHVDSPYYYATRFLLSDRAAQRADVTREVLCEEFVPCCRCKSVIGCVWGLLQSEIFLLGLHLTVVILGMLKIFIHIRETHEVLHLGHSAVESFLACIFIIIRAFKTKEFFHKVKITRLRLENVKSQGDTRSRAMKIITFAGIFIAFFLCSFIIGMFALFYIKVHLGWTILTNNAALLISTLASSVSSTRLSRMMDQIQLDQHKVVIYEASLLMSEIFWAITHEQQKRAKVEVEKFCKAIKATSVFNKPHYITCPEDSKWDIVTTMESGV